MNLHTKLVDIGDTFYFKNLSNSLSGCSTVLDLGCGDNSPLRKVNNIKYSVGFDLFKKSIEKSRKKKIHTEYKRGDLGSIEKHFKKKSFDAVIALDVVEHLEKKDSLTLIKKMEAIAKKRVIILTPNGFYHQDAYDNNPYQIHKSKWSVRDFKKLGFKVYGLRGLKYLRGEYATVKYKPWILWAAITFISEFILYLSPKSSYHIFAIKDLKR